ncbi:hypothetical protein R1flu_021167 [Riccia fluitans]|uniref:Uncharacterized protein n=1 Tax=Riccia fluitans TaxID=41844 RepID=A0ABD1ZNK6_9MARC
MKSSAELAASTQKPSFLRGILDGAVSDRGEGGPVFSTGPSPVFSPGVRFRNYESEWNIRGRTGYGI